MAVKNVTLRAFLFNKEPILSDAQEDDILPSAKKRLEATRAEEREMQLNQEDETRESDLLSGYDIQANNIFATMMRIAPGADDTHIDDTLMKQSSFSVGEIKRSSTTDRAIYKSHYYICFNNDFLVTTLSRTTSIARVETYLNWLLKSHQYTLVPFVVPTQDISIAELNKIIIKPQLSSKQEAKTDQTAIESKWLTLTADIRKKVLELLFKDTKSLSDIEMENVISTEVILKIQNKKIKNSDFQKIFGTFLKPVSEPDYIVFKNKNGDSITGSTILKTKSVKIELTDKNFLVEPNLHQEMARFLDELASIEKS